MTRTIPDSQAAGKAVDPEKPKGLTFDNSPGLEQPGSRRPGPVSREGESSLQFENSPQMDGTAREPVQIHDNSGVDVLADIGGYASVRQAVERGTFQRHNLNLRNADLSGVVLGRNNYKNTDFSGADLEGATFLDADLRQARFEDPSGTPRFVNCDLRGVSLAGLKARGATFVDCEGVDG